MNISCVICKDLFEPSDDIFTTQCGHIFHYNCIVPWLNQKKTCPQCRKQATVESSKSAHAIHRVFFDVNYEVSKQPVDATRLQLRVDSLEFEVKIKQKKVETSLEKCVELQKYNVGLRSEIKKLECDALKNTETIYILKEQLKETTKISNENDLLKRQVSHLKRSVDHMNTIKEIIHASPERMDNIISNIRDLDKIQTYATVLKRTLEESTNKNRAARDKIKILQKELSEVTRQRNFYSTECDKYSKLQEELAFIESEKIMLEKKVKELETGKATSTEDSEETEKTYKITKQAIRRSPNEELEDHPIFKKPKNSTIILNDTIFDSDVQQTPKLSKVKENEENSPYLPVKGGVTSLTTKYMKRSQKSSSSNSILVKKPRLMYNLKEVQGPMAYNGYGGHSKEEILPSSPESRTLKLKTKKPTINAVKPKKPKYDDLSNNAKIDSFIDLTKI